MRDAWRVAVSDVSGRNPEQWVMSDAADLFAHDCDHGAGPPDGYPGRQGEMGESLGVVRAFIECGQHTIAPSHDVRLLAQQALTSEDESDFLDWSRGGVELWVDGTKVAFRHGDYVLRVQAWRDSHWTDRYPEWVYVNLGEHDGVFFNSSGFAYVDAGTITVLPHRARGVGMYLQATPNQAFSPIVALYVWMAEWVLRLAKSVDSGVVVRSNEAEVRRAEMVLKNTRNPKKRRKAERVYRRTVYAFERPPQKAGGGGGRGTGAGVAKHRVRAHWHHYWVGPDHRGWEMGIKSNEDDTRRLVRKLVLGYERGSVEPDRSITAVR